MDVVSMQLWCRIIHTYVPEVHKGLIRFGSNSKGGRGGMVSKMTAAWMAAQRGVPTVISNGKAIDSILQARLLSFPFRCGYFFSDFF